jgi:hypothetical protein
MDNQQKTKQLAALRGRATKMIKKMFEMANPAFRVQRSSGEVNEQKGCFPPGTLLLQGDLPIRRKRGAESRRIRVKPG